ncbi:MAG: S24/S26 family peptidase [Clostridia bacterium]|nr:S24/S26 family peptidase [Clostridia bacterium]
MTVYNSEASAGVHALSVETWHSLAQKGAAPPVRLQVRGGSMRPLIRTGRDTVTVVPMARAARVGDIVLFRDGARYVLHRVWRVGQSRVQTFGDGCYRPDAWIDAKNILGLAVCVERGDRRIDPNARIWRAYARLWMGLRFFRKGIFYLYSAACRVRGVFHSSEDA